MKFKLTNHLFFHRKGFMLFIMKTYILLFCTTVFSFSSEKIYSQNTKITIETDKTITVDEVFDLIRKQTKYTFIYQEDLFKNTPKIALKKGIIQVDELLEKTVSSGKFEVIIAKNNTISITKKDFSQSTKSITTIQQKITGKVTDESGLPLHGVNVNIKQTNSGTITGFDGSYSITLNSTKDILVFSFLGYKTQEVLVESQTAIDLVMRLDEIKLEDILVSTGYQTLKKQRATGSFSKANMNVFKSRRGTQNVLSRLEGMIPGLTVSPNPNNSNIIRGISSIQLDREPLYAIDGVLVNDFSVINPEDIASVTVLKDAAATAIWGSKAANGVIVVTTKRGKRNEDIKMNYNSYVNFQGKPDFSYGRILTSKKYIQAARETFNSNNVSGALAPHETFLYDTYLNPDNAVANNASLDNLANIDNMQQIKDLWYRDAVTSGHTFSISGGATDYSFYSSVSYTDTQNNRPGDKSKGYSISLNQEYNLNKNLKVGLNLTLKNTASSSKRPISISNTFLPYQLFKDVEGNSINMPYLLGWSEAERLDYQERSQINLDYYPLEEMNYGHSKSNNLSLNLTGSLDLKLFKGLSYNGTYGYLKTPSTSKNYNDYKSRDKRQQLLGFTIAPDVATSPVYLFPTKGGTYVENNSEQRYWSLRNQLVYSTTFREGKDKLDVQLGQEANEQISSFNITNLEGYNELLKTYAYLDYATLANPRSDVVTPNGGYTTPFYETREDITRLTSYFALASYMFNDKYSIDGSWRVDHSNLFGSEKSAQNKPVWSIGGKWQLGKENFMKSSTWINDLSLRATYGITGNSPYAGAASSFDILSSPSSTSAIESIAGNYLSLISTANKKLSWESTKNINIGIDYSIFNQRITGSIDFYHKRTTDLLGQIPLNAFTGSSSARGNIGNLINKGIELSLNTTNLSAKNFIWTTNFVFSYNYNKLIDYAKPNYIQTASDYASLDYLAGYSMQPLFAYDFVGLDNLGDPLIQLSDGTITKDPLAVQVKDMKYMGTTQPVFNGGLSNQFSYKGFTLTANMIYSLGHVMRRDVNDFYTGRLTSGTSFTGNIHSDFDNRWREPGDEAFTNIPSYESDNYASFTRRNTDFYTQGDENVVSASYIKLRDITFSYNLPEIALNTLHLDAFSLNVQIGNFMVWKANKVGIDPEFNDDYRFGSRSIPQSKHPVTFGINISL